ncbi:ABC transporter ATP-binding protein [Jeotgalibacillus sp. R-1-5s-1]|uniref:ABC transporter ATP-binding protein n=1 Tax=Jeotgalibacillus sp. R-1-5s-1 TaxID=2555897 RepID=UPI00106D12F0|nr:ABC transporter transmembrane domain-containing protein [Jeotgalibacillus sp. R-1-5s-1]TFD97680.1 ATP-binding cassette domain-containing protein [Jeotgalibacillus sp. R-1-5s-1]
MFDIFIKLGWFFKEHWKRYTIAIILLLIANVVEIVPPFLVGMAIDDIFVGELTQELLVQYVMILAGIAVVAYIINYVWQYLLFSGAHKIERRLRSMFMGHMLKMTPTFYERNRTGDLMARATNDLKAVSVTAGFGVLTLIDSTAYMLTIIVAMGFLVSWELTIAAILPLPILAIVMQFLGKKIHERYTQAQDAFGDLNDRVLESVAGVRVIRAYVQEREDEKTFFEGTEDVYQKNLKVAFIDSLFNPLTKIITGMSYMIGLGYGSYLVFNQSITLGELVAFNVYLGMLIWPMFAVGELINIMQRGNASLDRVNETLNYTEDVPDPLQPAFPGELQGIEFKQTDFQYPSSNVPNLSNVSVRIDQGQTLGIVGKTGSGKTTFVKQLLKEYPLGEGDIVLSGISIAEQKRNHVLSWIGYVPQEHVLFSKTVRENILFGADEASEEDIIRAIKMAHFEKDLEMLPDGLETLVGEKGVALSGGQKQRISIARALIDDPSLLILDDSLSAVDAKTESAILENIKNERKGKTTIITTHRLSAVEHADWILVINEGCVMEEGTHQQLIERKGWYFEQFERQQVEESLLEEVRS